MTTWADLFDRGEACDADVDAVRETLADRRSGDADGE